jgi:hypothetical protein
MSFHTVSAKTGNQLLGIAFQFAVIRAPADGTVACGPGAVIRLADPNFRKADAGALSESPHSARKTSSFVLQRSGGAITQR